MGLPNSKTVVKNTLLNLLGSVLPLPAAFLAIPILLRSIGAEQFGILTLVWLFVGYFSLFDLGLGRAVTKMVAERLDTEEEAEVTPLFWTASLAMSLASLVGMLLLLLSARWLVDQFFHIQPEVREATVRSLQVVAVTLPFVVHTSALRGFLMALQRFDQINMIRIPQGILNFVGPLLVLPFSGSLLAIVQVLCGLRAIIWGAHLVCCLRSFPGLRNYAIERRMLAVLLRLGGWMTISNLLSPLLVYVDRLVIGGMVSATLLAYYSAPYQMVVRLLIIPIALQSVLFSSLSYSLARDIGQALAMVRQAFTALFLVQLPIILTVILGAKLGLQLWLGEEIAGHSYRVLQILVIGVFFNGLALIPFSFLQGAGRPDLTAKFHMLQSPFYVLLLWLGIRLYGIDGAAAAWSCRMLADLLMLMAAIYFMYPGMRRFVQMYFALIMVALCLFLGCML